EGDWHDAKLEGWASLAALAPLTSTARLGLLVAANTFRNPGLTAKLAVTLDHLSNGRFTLGIGGGWFAREHEAFGFDFGSGFRARGAAVGVPCESIDKTGYREVVIRAYESEVRGFWAEVEERHGIRGRVGSDGTPRLLNAGGPPEAVADYVRGFESMGIDEV